MFDKVLNTPLHLYSSEHRSSLQVCNFIKKRPQHSCFLVNIAKFLRTAFLQNICGGCFYICKTSSKHLNSAFYLESVTVILFRLRSTLSNLRAVTFNVGFIWRGRQDTFIRNLNRLQPLQIKYFSRKKTYVDFHKLS